MKKLSLLLLLISIKSWSAPFIPPGAPPANTNTAVVNCSGTADDVAINAAATKLVNAGTGGTVQIVGTNCIITSAVLLQTGVYFNGNGPGATVLQLSANNTNVTTSLANVFYGQASSTANLTNFGVSNLTIDGNFSTQGQIAFNGNLVYATATGTVNLITGLTYPYTVSGSNNAITFNLNSAGVNTATIASATYSTPQALMSAIQTAVTAANASVSAYQSGGSLVLAAPNESTSFVVTSGGNASATYMGTLANIVYFTSNFSDNDFNGIEVRGSANQNYRATNFFIRNVETRNNGFHGVAIYDGADEFTVEGNNSHDNGYRCIHVHSAVSKQPSTKYSIIKNLCHDDGRGLMLPGLGGSGLFVFFNGARDVVVTDNIVWNEPDDSLAITGANDGDTYLTDGVIVANNTVLTSGNGILINATTATLSGLTITGNSVRDVSYPFIIGSATAGLTIGSTNNTLSVTLGASTQTVTIPSSTYTAASLATALALAINTQFNTTGSGVTVTATSTTTTPNNLIRIVPVFTDGNVNDVFTVAAGASNSAYAYIFGSAPVAYGNSCLSNVIGAAANCAPKGTRVSSFGNGITMLSTGNFQITNTVMSENRVHNTGYYGVKLFGTSTTYPITKLSFSGNVVDAGGLDQGIGSACLGMENVYESAFTGGTLTGCNNLSANGYQLSLISGDTVNTFTGIVIDSLGAGIAVPVTIEDATSKYNVMTGNMFNRGSSNTGNQYNNAGVSNIIYNNELGSTGAGTAVNQPGVGTTGSIGGSPLSLGVCATGTASVANAAIGQVVNVTPASLTAPGTGFNWFGQVTTAFSGATPGTVTVSVCAETAGTPTATTYNVRVQP